MKKVWTTTLAMFALAGCCMTGGGGVPVASGAPGMMPAGAVIYTADPTIPTWSAGYAASMMQDNNPSTYWCTPMGPVFPIITTITLAAPTNVMDVDFDTRLPGYDTSAIRDVVIEPLVNGMPVGAPVSASLAQNNVTSVPVVAMGATAIRFTFLSNFGGAYAGLSELTVLTMPGVGLPPLPSMGGMPTIPSIPMPPIGLPPAPAGPGIAFTVDPSIPTWSAGYSSAMMQDMDPSTYWCTPMSPTFPVVTTLFLPMPSTVTGLAFNTAISGYDNIGPRDVMIEAIDPMGAVVGVANGVVLQNTTSTVALPMPALASSLRLTIRANYGGSYLGIAELSVMGIGLPPLPGT